MGVGSGAVSSRPSLCDDSEGTMTSELGLRAQREGDHQEKSIISFENSPFA